MCYNLSPTVCDTACFTDTSLNIWSSLRYADRTKRSGITQSAFRTNSFLIYVPYKVHFLFLLITRMFLI
jgi:hypothetical protein